MDIINSLIDRGVEVNYRNLGHVYTTGYRVKEESIELNWQFVDNGEGLPTSYKIYLDDEEIAEVIGKNYTFTNLTPNTEYSIRIAPVKNGVLTDDWNAYETIKQCHFLVGML